MKKQTAVEWLVEKVMVWENDHEKWIEIPTRELEDFLRQAKAMEREQIEHAFDVGYDSGSETPPSKYPVEYHEASDYYNETYKGGER